MSDQSGGVQAGPAKPRDEVAIRRKIYAAITEADDLLRSLAYLNDDAPETQSEIRRVRGLLAEWRLETD